MSLVQSFTTGSYAVTRQNTNGTFVEGVFKPGAPSRFPVSGSLQPLSDRDTQVLPELYRTRQTYKLYSDAVLLTEREFGMKRADRVVLYGESYVVFSTNRWDGTSIPYKRYVLVKEDVERESGETQ